MGSQVTKRGPKPPEMNMTPLIDVTFQLILFFMLVNNIIAEDSLPLIPPRLDKPQVVEQPPEIEKVNVNVAGTASLEDANRRKNNPLFGDGKIGKIRVGPLKEWNLETGDKALPTVLEEVTETLKQFKADAQAKGKELEVNLRADASLHYIEVQPVIVAVTGAEIKTVNLVAYLDEEP